MDWNRHEVEREKCYINKKVGEALKIGDDVTITVLSVKGHQVGYRCLRMVHRESYNRIKFGDDTIILAVKMHLMY